MLKTIHQIPPLPTRPIDAHKGSFGRVLVIGGSVGMAGAPSLVGNAALRSGAGLVTLAVPEPILNVVAALCPCATTIPLPTTESGQIEPVATTLLLRSQGWIIDKQDASGSNKSNSSNPLGLNHWPDAVVIGPGLGMGSLEYAESMWQLIDAFRIGSQVPTVIDADALNLAAVLPNNWHSRAHPRTIISPHPGELARWRGVTTGDIQKNRQESAVDTAVRMNHYGVQASTKKSSHEAQPAVVILKGAGTLVTDGGSLYTNTTGNPGMATGGSGDVLSGVLGTLLGQGFSTLDAAILGVYVHGLAGDCAAHRVGQVSLIATDIISALPEAFVAITKSLSH